MAKLSPNDIARAFLKDAKSEQLDLGALLSDLAVLATEVSIESIDVNPRAIEVLDEARFNGVATANVALTDKGGFVVGEEVPVSFAGSVDQAGRLHFESLRADLTPFAE